MFTTIIISILASVSTTCYATDDNSAVKLKQTVAFGGNREDGLYSTILSKDGGYVGVGYSTSLSLNVGDSTLKDKGGKDAIIIRFDKDGNRIWGRQFAGSLDETFYSIIESNEKDGYVVAGETFSSNSGISLKGKNDAVIIKYSEYGSTEWINTFGGKNNDSFNQIINTSDNGYIAVGSSSSTDAGIPNNGATDAVIIKYDNLGQVEWAKNFGGSSSDYYYSVSETHDGGYIAVGDSSSYNAGFTHSGGTDIVIVKYSKNGTQEWIKSWGFSGDENVRCIKASKDNGFILSGFTNTSIHGVTSGGTDAILAKLDQDGNIEWFKAFGGTSSDYFISVDTTDDGGFITIGHSDSLNAGFPSKGLMDTIIVKYDSNGTQKWVKSIGGLENDYGNQIINIGEDRYIATTVLSNGGGLVSGYGSLDAVLVILEENKLKGFEDISISFKQPHALSVTLSSNTVDFGNITGIEETENKDSLTLTITSSAAYNVDMKASDDIIGTNDSTNVIDISKLQVSADTDTYQPLSKNYTPLISNQSKGTNINHSLNFKLDSTFGVKADSYSAPIKINVEQM